MSAEINVKAHITVKIDEEEYSLVCSNSTDLGRAYSAWQQIGNWLVERIQQDLAARKPQEAAQEAPKEG